MSTDDFTDLSPSVDNTSDPTQEEAQQLPDDLSLPPDPIEEELIDPPVEPLDEDPVEDEELEIMDDWLKGITAHAQGDPQAPLEEEEESEEQEEEEWATDHKEVYEDELEEEEIIEETPYQHEDPAPQQDSMGAVFGRMMTKDNLELMGQIAFDKTDLLKAKVCGYLENQHYSDFRTSEEMKQIVIGNFKAFFKEANIKIPPSSYILLGSLAMWLAPLGLAGVKRYGQYLVPLIQSLATPKTANTPPTQKHSAKAYPNPNYDPDSPYAHLREYQQGRKFFRVHSSTGKYAYHPTNSSIYFNPQEGVETPSPEIMEWKDEDLKDKDIRALLYD